MREDGWQRRQELVAREESLRRRLVVAIAAASEGKIFGAAHPAAWAFLLFCVSKDKLQMG